MTAPGPELTSRNVRDVVAGWRKADVTLLNCDVRFTPESGHSTARSGGPLWAKLGHHTEFVRQKILGFKAAVLSLRSTNSRAHYAVLTRQRSQRVRHFMLPAGDSAGNRRAEDGRQPEQPELRDIRSAGKQRRAGAARRID